MALSRYQKKMNALIKSMQANGFSNEDSQLLVLYLAYNKNEQLRTTLFNLCIKSKLLQTTELKALSCQPELKAKLQASLKEKAKNGVNQ
jgi:hypothetical protein